MKKVTIITTTYHHEHFIAETIESILSQTSSKLGITYMRWFFRWSYLGSYSKIYEKLSR